MCRHLQVLVACVGFAASLLASSRAGGQVAESAPAAPGSPQNGVDGPPTPIFSELLINPPANDNGLESIEIMGPPGAVLNNVFIIVLEGDGAGAGMVDLVIPLSELPIGQNGLLLLRDSTMPLMPPPDVGTTVVIRDFTPDLENGAITFILGRAQGAVPQVGADLDVDNDGQLDAPLPMLVFDAVSFLAGTAGAEYADDVGGTALGSVGSFTPGGLYRLLDRRCLPFRWLGGVVVGAAPGPFTFAPNASFGFENTGIDPMELNLNLGTLNRKIDLGACCVSSGACIDRVLQNECLAAGGVFHPNQRCSDVGCAPDTPVINDFFPRTIERGQLITVIGRNFPNNPDNICLVAKSGNILIPFEIVDVAPDVIHAIAGPIPPQLGPAELRMMTGEGVRAGFRPAFFDIFVEDPLDTWVWRGDGAPFAAGPGELIPVFTPDPPNVSYTYGTISNGRLCLFIQGAWSPNKKVTLWNRLHGTAGGTQFAFWDLMTCVRFRWGGSAADCARRICDSISCAFGQQNPPIIIDCTVTPVAGGAFKIEISIPNGNIECGTFTLCTEMPDMDVVPPNDFPITAFGQAVIDPHPVGLRISNIGSSGQDGVSVQFPTGNNLGALVEIIPIDLDIPTRCLNLDAWAPWNGNDCWYLGRGSLWGRPQSCLDAFGDFSSVGSSTVRIDIFNDGLPVGTVVRPNGNVGVVQGIAGARVPLVDCWGKLPPRPIPCFFFNFADDFAFTPVGSTDPIVGDSLRILANAPSAPIASLELLDQSLGTPATAPLDVVIRGVQSIAIGACCLPNGRCVDGLTQQACEQAAGIFFPGAECGSGIVCPGGDVVINDFFPRQIRRGDILTVIGANFPLDPNDVCLVAKTGNILIPFEILDITPQQIVALAGPIPPDAGPAELRLMVGDGARGPFRPAFFDIFIEDPNDTWVWRGVDMRVAIGPGNIFPIPTPDPPNVTYTYGTLTNGRLCLFIQGAWSPNKKVTLWNRLHGTANGAPFVFWDLMTCVRFRWGGSAEDCARRICDSISCAFGQQSPPIIVDCTVTPVPGGAFKIEVSIPNGVIECGTFTLCTEMPDMDIILPGNFPATAFGQALIEPLPAGLRVENFGTGGGDGVSIQLPDRNDDGLLVEINPFDLDIPMRCLNLDAWGPWNGNDCWYLGRGSLWGRPNSCLDAFGDFSSVGSQNVIVRIFDGDIQRPDIRVPNGNLGVVQGLNGARVPFVDCWGKLPPRPIPCFFFNFADRFAFTPVNSTIPTFGTSLRILADQPSAPIETLELFDQSIGNPTDAPKLDLVLRGASLIVKKPECPCDFNDDRSLNSQDFFDFVTCFFTPNCAAADYNNSGAVNSQDFFDFLTCFFAPPQQCF